MNIVHYSLGFPPYRRGGMTTYCMNLMHNQIELGNDLALLWPGSYSIHNKKTIIKKNRKYIFKDGKMCVSYELINGLPVSLLDGIQDTIEFSKQINENIFIEFFRKNKIDVFHVHSLMGLPKECISAAKKTGVKTFFTVHDYFGICFKWGLFKNNQICTNNQDCKACVACNQTALSLKKIAILQSSLYRWLKDSPLVKILRKRHNDELYLLNHNKSAFSVGRKNEKYIALRQYYVEIIESFDMVLFNSTQTEKIYKQYSNINNSRVLNVTHVNISKHVNMKVYDETLNIGYLGPLNVHKGFYFIKQVLDELYSEKNIGFKLHIYDSLDRHAPYIITHRPYSYKELPHVMQEIDILVVPSQWYETFGFTVLEALSFGVPVIVSENVGAKDLVVNGKNGYILPNTIEAWYDKIKFLIDNRSHIVEMREYINDNQNIVEFAEHTRKIIGLYQVECTK